MTLKRIRRTLYNGLRLRCPRCGRAPLFRTAFAMHAECGVCGLQFEREQGYFVGAIYINYGATVLVAMLGYLLLDSFKVFSLTFLLVVCGAFTAVFPLVFFRHAKSLWLALDHVFSPEPASLRVVRNARKRHST